MVLLLVGVSIPLKLVYEGYELKVYEKVYGKVSADSRKFALAVFPPFAEAILELAEDRGKAINALVLFYKERLKQLEEFGGDLSISGKAYEIAKRIAKNEICHTAKVLASPILLGNKKLKEEEKTSLLLELTVNGPILGISLTDYVVSVDLEKCT